MDNQNLKAKIWNVNDSRIKIFLETNHKFYVVQSSKRQSHGVGTRGGTGTMMYQSLLLDCNHLALGHAKPQSNGARLVCTDLTMYSTPENYKFLYF